VSEAHGRIIAAHLAWSGDHHLLVERDTEGCASVMIAPRVEAGEIILGPTESYTTPTAMFAFSNNGLSGVRDKFHAKANALAAQAKTPRKVHLNSWEALGFDFDLPSLQRLADEGSALGVERFVLDDGWFKGRRDDTTSLGDWFPDPQIFPDGLGRLIDHVKSRDMDFGLWVEPEMVSPDSDMYRNHPDWCLHSDGISRATQRNQLVLNLDRPEVSKALFDQLDSLLCDHDIAYLKWDHNRDLFPLAGQGHAQTRALYALLDKVRAVHPRVEIESCASGGGRVDFEILRRCSRVWASDNNDAIERLRINRSWLQFLPLKVIGNHVGPSPNPVTGRRLSMDFRAKVALFGHMGVEADPATMSESERKSLATHIAIYKEWRTVLHGGRLTQIESTDPGIFGWLSWNGERGLALVAQTRFADDFNAQPVQLVGLPVQDRYRVRLIEPWPARAVRSLPNPDLWREGYMVSGHVLSEIGLPLPLRLPETAWLISVETVNE
jgi:alpha-galactosidase